MQVVNCGFLRLVSREKLIKNVKEEGTNWPPNCEFCTASGGIRPLDPPSSATFQLSVLTFSGVVSDPCECGFCQTDWKSMCGVANQTGTWKSRVWVCQPDWKSLVKSLGLSTRLGSQELGFQWEWNWKLGRSLRLRAWFAPSFLSWCMLCFFVAGSDPWDCR